MDTTRRTSINTDLKTAVEINAAEVAASPDRLSQSPNTITDLIKLRAAESLGDEPIIGYPDHGTHYVDYTPKQLDEYATRVATHYTSLLPCRVSSKDQVQVIGLLGISNLDYLFTFLAISRLGHTVLFLSTRISDEAYISLLERTGATTLICDKTFFPRCKSLQKEMQSIKILPICTEDVWAADGAPTSNILDSQNLDSGVEASNISWIIHSSGSTGLPKPIYQTHSAALRNYASNFNLPGFITLPLFHAHGLSCLFRAITSRKKILIYNASLPLTATYLETTLSEHKLGIFYGVPYALKLLNETPNGMQLLARLEIVMFGGSACPKPIGDALVQNGVNIVSHYGSTETGQLMTSFREQGDKDWDYVRPDESLKPFLRWEERGPGIFEICVLKGWPSLVTSNRDDGSYATKDLFEPHPTTPDAWRYYARLDDTLVLDNGEKANPLLLEGVAKKCRYVDEAIAFGDNKPRVGLFVIPAESASELSDSELIEALWPSVEESNKVGPAYAKLSKDMVCILPKDAITRMRKTDKGTVIRAAFYRDLKAEIDAMYVVDETGGTLVLEGQELIDFLRKELLSVVTLPDPTVLTTATDLFAIGVDSLQTTLLRNKLVQQLDLGQGKLSQNFVFENPSLEKMAEELQRVRTGQTASEVSIEEQMQQLIDRYSSFDKHVPGALQNTDEQTYVVTGATGSLGAHIVARLVALPKTRKVYCLVRARSGEEATKRVQHSMQDRRIYDSLSSDQLDKIVSLPSTFGEAQLGLDAETFQTVSSQLTAVIHCAWSVNFNYGLSSFEKDCIAGIRNLINLCLASKLSTPASFNFCSSVSAVVGTPTAPIPEALPAQLSYAQGMGYARSKLVAEHICTNAARQTNLCSRVLRVGQISGDTQFGVWNATEAIPLMLQSATTIGALPTLDESPAWLPVDTVAQTCIELTNSEKLDSHVLNVVNHNNFHWTRDLLPLLRKAGLEFEEVPQREWIKRLRASSPDPVVNPPIKLVEFFAGKYDNDRPRGRMVFESDVARRFSETLDGTAAITEDAVRRFVGYFREECWGRK